MQQLGEVLKRIRIEKSFSYEMLSKDICSPQYLYEVEEKHEIPNLRLLKRVCERLSMTVDELMSLCESYGYDKVKWLSFMHHFYLVREFQKLTDLCDIMQASEINLSAVERQTLIFYQATCHLYLDNNVEYAIVSYQQSLSCTYLENSQAPTDMEILIINELGYAYFMAGDIKKAEQLMLKSVNLFFSYQHSSVKSEFVRIFYNYALLLMELVKVEEAMEMVNIGISWCRKKMSMYMLEDFLYLKAILLEDNEKLDEAVYFVELAEKLHTLENDNKVIKF